MVRAIRAAAACTLAVLAGAKSVEPDPRPLRKAWEDDRGAEVQARQAVAAKEKKMAAVSKAVELLETLRHKVLEEGEAEAKTYSKFACFCKDTSADKFEDIQKGTDEHASLIADIASLSSKRDGLDTLIQDTTNSLAMNSKAMKVASEERLHTLRQYEADAADLMGALTALEAAIKTLKTSKTPALMQVSQSLHTALALADTLNLGSAKDLRAIAFLQNEPANGNAVPMEDYDFHSGGIISTLEKLLQSFRAEKVSLDEDEVHSNHEHDSFMQQSTDKAKQLNRQLDDAKEEKDQTIAEIQESSQRLTTVQATLRDDKSYASELSLMCSNKAKTWDQRSRVRADEVSALTQALGIIKTTVSDKTSAATVRFMQRTPSVRRAVAVASDPSAMEAIELAVEEAPSFLQLHRASSVQAVQHLRGSGGGGDDGRAVVLDLLSMQGEKLHSTLLTALAGKIASDPFAKIKTLVQELIERLQAEAANEANQKGWCDKAQADAKQKRQYAGEKIRAVNAQMAKDEALRDALEEELVELAKATAEIDSSRREAQEERQNERNENQATMAEAKDGLSALNMCIDLLDKFYKTIAKESVDLSLVERGPLDDAPNAGFDNGEAYQGGQGESGGILAMLDVMKSDFARTISVTEEAEKQAQQDYSDFMTKSGISLATKKEADKAKRFQLDDTNSRLDTATERLKAQGEILQTSIKELLELKPVCVDTGMSYEDRVARREDEIASLNKAQCILGRVAEYGPDAAGEGC